MEFVFFDASGARLFARNDAESATHVHEEMSLQALFPYDTGKVIQRGQRIGYTDALGVFQPFEIRKVRTYEPDHYQEITAEHIVVSELSDEHLDQTEITNKTAVQALTALLTGTLWAVGTNTASGAQTADISRGSVWQGVRSIEENWNVYITPRVTFNAAGITGRYLDIAPAAPTWRGVRLSLDKNSDEMGVTWDDTNVITAIYGYGGRVADTSGDDTETLTFADVEWTATASHPAKPDGQTYLEDPTAKALYGRNGRNRFGYYQNSNIDDPEILLEKSWEALKQSNAPDVAIDCRVSDLYRLGYADQPLALHDTAIIEVRPTGETLQREIIRLSEDLLDPTATQVNIGVYIPNIVYMQRETEKAARGGGGGGGRGGGGGGGQDNQFYEFTTSIQQNQYQIALNATHWADADSILTQAGMTLNAQGVLIYADDNPNMVGAKIKVNADNIAAEVTRATAAEGALSGRITVNADNITAEVIRATAAEGTLSGRITVEAGKITQIVEAVGDDGEVTAASIVAAVNDSESSVTINANKIILDGTTSIDQLLTGRASITKIWATAADIGNLGILPGGSISVGTGELFVNRTAALWKSATVVTGVTITDATVNLSTEHTFIYGTASSPQAAEKGHLVTSRTNGSHTVTTDTLYYLGNTPPAP